MTSTDYCTVNRLVTSLFICTLLSSSTLSAQEFSGSKAGDASRSMNRQLDSLMNRMPVFGKTTIVYRQQQRVVTDTINMSRYKLQKDDSCILFRYKGKTEKRIRAADMWGIVNEYGERRRLYNGKSLTLWRTEAPYVYRVETNFTVYYYFSETLSGTVYPLSNDLVESTIQDEATKNQLYSYMRRYDISGTGVDKKPSQEFLLATADFLLEFGINFTGIILECFLNSLCK